MAWYGKAFYFVELPRRFMVTLWGSFTSYMLLPEQWMAVVVSLCCLTFDIFVTARAPDLRLTREAIEAKLSEGRRPVHIPLKELSRMQPAEVEAKLATGDRLYYLTMDEFWHRVKVLLLGIVAIAAVQTYWFYNGQPEMFGQVALALIVLVTIAYFSALGIPMRTASEMPEGSIPFRFSIFPLMSKRLGLVLFAWPVWFFWAGFGITWIMVWYGMANNDYQGNLLGAILCASAGYLLWMVCIALMPMAIFDRKISRLYRIYNFS